MTTEYCISIAIKDDDDGLDIQSVARYLKDKLNDRYIRYIKAEIKVMKVI